MEYNVHPKENLYFTMKLIVSLVVYGGIILAIPSLGKIGAGAFGVFIVYGVMFALYFMFTHGLLIGYLRGNAIRINENQFPELFAIAKEEAEKLKLAKMPAIYILQAGGLLNAFATRFYGKDFVVLYSDVVELAFEKGNETVHFIIGHELGHIKRKHMTKNLLLFPGLLIPFLGPAYSRACEYTCDRIGSALSPGGAVSGLLVLAAGKYLHTKVNVEEYINSAERESGFWKWLSEMVSSHPNLPKRIAEINGSKVSQYSSGVETSIQG
jgi:Zn-dependent protease with chaperone function